MLQRFSCPWCDDDDESRGVFFFEDFEQQSGVFSWSLKTFDIRKGGFNEDICCCFGANRT